MSYNFDAAVSPFIKALPPSGLAKFLDIMAANPNIVPLSVGEPDFDIPQAVKDAEINSICEGKKLLHSYARPFGAARGNCG